MIGNVLDLQFNPSPLLRSILDMLGWRSLPLESQSITS